MSDPHQKPDDFERITTALAMANITLAVGPQRANDMDPDALRAVLEELASGHRRAGAKARGKYLMLNRAHRLAAHAIEQLVDMPAGEWPL